MDLLDAAVCDFLALIADVPSIIPDRASCIFMKLLDGNLHNSYNYKQSIHEKLPPLSTKAEGFRWKKVIEGEHGEGEGLGYRRSR